jgi:hypothetical protein
MYFRGQVCALIERDDALTVQRWSPKPNLKAPRALRLLGRSLCHAGFSLGCVTEWAAVVQCSAGQAEEPPGTTSSNSGRFSSCLSTEPSLPISVGLGKPQ